MTLENITKEEWDSVFKETITTIEEDLKEYMTIYKQMLDLRSQYRKDYKTNRIIHQFDIEEGIISYKLGAKRKVGYQIRGK